MAEPVVEWAVRVAFAGNPEHINPQPSKELAQAVADDMGHHGAHAEVVCRTVTPWQVSRG